jgi:hypothetical protein
MENRERVSKKLQICISQNKRTLTKVLRKKDKLLASGEFDQGAIDRIDSQINDISEVVWDMSEYLEERNKRLGGETRHE